MKLLLYAKANKSTPSYAAQVIAAEYGHLVYFTPPYHPELQPIELVWGQVKNRLAANPSIKIAELKEKVECGFDNIASEDWVRAYRHVQRFEDRYNAPADDDEVSSSSATTSELGVFSNDEECKAADPDLVFYNISL